MSGRGEAVIERATKVFDCRTQLPVEGQLCIGLTTAQILAVESVWGPARHELRDRLLMAGVSHDRLPQHLHWNWIRKMPKLVQAGYQGLGIMSDGSMEALMTIARTGYRSRLVGDTVVGLIYIDYLEIAPWNLSTLVATPRYKGCGVALLRAAVEISIEEGCHGRVGLHSLPQACDFYDKVGMVSLGADDGYDELSYYELPAERAVTFLARGR